MKKKRFFPGIILIGFGAYFFLQQSNITLFDQFYTWPTLLMIVGIAFLFQGYGAKDYESILPGVILTGFGIHFHVAGKLDMWPDTIGSFILIIALALLLRYQKTSDGLFQGLLFLIIAVLLLFYEQVTKWLGILENSVHSIWNFWPVVLVGFGVYFLARKK